MVATGYSGKGLQSERVVTEHSGHVCSQKGLSLNTVAMSGVTKGCQ